MTDDPVQPPSFLAEDMRDLLVPASPRLVVITDRRWMEPYHSLEEGELSQRLTAGREHTRGFELWLRALTLYRAAFTGVFDWGEDTPSDTVEALNIRADLLALAGSTSKPALDNLMAGYYWAAFGMIRGLLETWRRAVYVRLRPEKAPEWFKLPEVSPIGTDGQPRKGRQEPPRFTDIEKAISADGSDEDKILFGLVNAGVIHMHSGAHPSAEGTTQLWTEIEGRRVFGPTYSRPLCAFGLKWGLFSHWVLLREIQVLRPQGPDWVRDYYDLHDNYGAWQQTYNAEFGDPAPAGTL